MISVVGILCALSCAHSAKLSHCNSAIVKLNTDHVGGQNLAYRSFACVVMQVKLLIGLALCANCFSII